MFSQVYFLSCFFQVLYQRVKGALSEALHVDLSGLGIGRFLYLVDKFKDIKPFDIDDDLHQEAVAAEVLTKFIFNLNSPMVEIKKGSICNWIFRAVMVIVQWWK